MPDFIEAEIINILFTTIFLVILQTDRPDLYGFLTFYFRYCYLFCTIFTYK